MHVLCKLRVGRAEKVFRLGNFYRAISMQCWYYIGSVGDKDVRPEGCGPISLQVYDGVEASHAGGISILTCLRRMKIGL